MAKAMWNTREDSSGLCVQTVRGGLVLEKALDQELLVELEKTSRALEATVPAHPMRPENERKQDRLSRALSKYFKSLEKALDPDVIAQIYYGNVRQTDE